MTRDPEHTRIAAVPRRAISAYLREPGVTAAYECTFEFSEEDHEN